MFCPTHLFFFPFSSKKGVCNTEYSSGDFVGKLQVVVMLWEANGISRNKTRLYFRSASLKNVKDLLRIFMAALFSWIPLRSQHDWRIFRAGLELRSWRKGLRNRGDGSKWRWKEKREEDRETRNNASYDRNPETRKDTHTPSSSPGSAGFFPGADPVCTLFQRLQSIAEELNR